MAEVNVSKLRRDLPRYLASVRRGGEITITSRGRPVARLVPHVDRRAEARERLGELRRAARVGDVLSPVDEAWEAER